MNNRYPSRETIDRLREQYPAGTRVELVSMNDPYSNLRPGDKGRVSAIDDTGTIFVDWDKGSGLGIVYGEDSVRRIEQERHYDTGADFWRDTAASYGLEEATVICTNYFATQIRTEDDSERQFCRELFAAMHEDTASRAAPARIVYPYSFAHAKDRSEESAYHDSRGRTESCARDIDAAIKASCYKPNFYNLETAAQKVLAEYGFDRVNTVLAHNLQNRSYEGRFSGANKRWAAEIELGDRFTSSAILNAHPILIDGFVDHARQMYEELGAERFALPGRPEEGEKVQGYEIYQSIQFDNQRGFALAHAPDMASPFVTWQFTAEDSARDFYWGRYHDEEQGARDSFRSRVSVYMQNDNIREVHNPLAAVEMTTEQNYNMIDGLRNNIAYEKADLTDGQTHEELRELAPETIPGPEGKPSLLGQVEKIKAELPPHTPSGRSGPPEREL